MKRSGKKSKQRSKYAGKGNRLRNAKNTHTYIWSILTACFHYCHDHYHDQLLWCLLIRTTLVCEITWLLSYTEWSTRCISCCKPLSFDAGVPQNNRDPWCCSVGLQLIKAQHPHWKYIETWCHLSVSPGAGLGTGILEHVFQEMCEHDCWRGKIVWNEVKL